MKKVILPALLLSSLLCANDVDFRIINGTTVSSSDSKWEAIASFNGQCGASLIAKNFVLTAAHCVLSNDVTNQFVILGTTSLNDKLAQQIGVKRIVTHPQYSGEPNYANDIALVELSSDVTSITPMTLKTQDNLTEGQTSYVAGWGNMSTTGENYPSDLMEVMLPIIDLNTCNASYNTLTNKQICAGYMDGSKDSCQGDSGGPLITQEGEKWLLSGIVSYGGSDTQLCGAPNYPGIYTKVSSYIDWINSYTGATTTPTDDNTSATTFLLWRHAKTNQNVIWFMENGSVASYKFLPAVDSRWYVGAIGDINADQNDDILWRNSTTGQNIAWLMQNGQKNSYTFLPAVGDSRWQIADINTFNGDSDEDILWRNAQTGQNILWNMNGTTKVSYEFLPAVDKAWQIKGSGDFNFDKKNDIVWRNSATGQNVVWFMDNTTLSSYTLLSRVATNWDIGAVVDIDEDGNDDIVWRDYAYGRVGYWKMYGTSSQKYVALPLVKDTNWHLVGGGTYQ